MRHRVKTTQLNRDTNHRHALLMNLVRSLVEQGAITTSKGKARVVKQLADKFIGMAQDDSVASRRQLHKFFGKRDVVNTLVEKIAPAMKDRKSGFVTISIVGNRRGDNTLLAKISLVTQPEKTGSLKSGQVYAKSVVKAKPAVKKAVAKKPTATKPVAKKVVTKKPAAKKPAIKA